MTTRTRAALLMAATALIWSSGGLAIKLVDLHPMALTGCRSALSALTLLALFRSRLSFSPSAPMVWGGLGYAAMLTTVVAATKLTTSANAILLAYTAPVYVALAAPLALGERTRRADWAFIAVTIGGMALFFLDKLSPAGLWGCILAVIGGMSYATFTLCMRAQKDASPLECALLGHALTALVGLPFLYHGLPDASDLMGLLYLGIIQQGISLALYSWSIQRLGALEAILITTLEPIFNPVWVALGYGEMPGPWAIAGGIVVVGAVTLRGAVSARRNPAVPGDAYAGLAEDK